MLPTGEHGHRLTRPIGFRNGGEGESISVGICRAGKENLQWSIQLK